MSGLFGTRQKRLALTGLFFVVAFAILSAFSYKSDFCSFAETGRSHALTTARLAFACTAWSLLAGLCAHAVSAAANARAPVRPLLSAVIAGAGFVSVPFWIYRGYGEFLLANTWADVSCFFVEGFGISFAFVAAPMLALTTLICEWLLMKTQST